jgi:hypothetical protein
MWKVPMPSSRDENKCDLVWADADESGLIAPDTLDQVWGGLSEYAAATTSKRRWAAASDYTDLRFFVKEGSSTTEWEVPDQADQGLAIAALTDTTALVIWASFDFGFRWAIAGDQWYPGGPVPDTYWMSERPRLRRRPSGGLWLTWGGGDSPLMRNFDQGVFGPYREIDQTFEDEDPTAYWCQSVEASRDDREWPSLVWTRYSRFGKATEVCAAIPDENGNYDGMVIPNSVDGGLASILRDRYGDVWLGWFVFSDAMYWTHSYTAAEALQPVIERSSHEARLTWAITERSPGSHWTILRSTNGASWDSLGAVSSAQDSILAWTDASVAPESIYRYQVRRDCLDSRHVQWSPVADSPSIALPPFALRVDSRASSGGRLRLTIRGAPRGSVRIQLFDIAGRLVGSGLVENQGGPYDEQPAVLELGHVVARGIYFARALDVTGRISPTERVVMLAR